MLKKLFYLFVFFAPFTSFFALGDWLRIPVLINLILFFVAVISVFKNKKIKNNWLLSEDSLLIGFLILVWVSFLFGTRNQRSFNHSLAYTNAVLLYFFLSKYVFKLLKISTIEVAKIIYWSFLAVSLIIIIDFIGINFFDFSLRRLFSDVNGKTSNMDYYIRWGFKRVGGVAEEPGSMAIFYNIYFGITLYYLNFNSSIKKHIGVLFIFILCHFFLFSSAGMTLPILAVCIIFIINILKKYKISVKQISVVLKIFVAIIFASIVIFLFDIEMPQEVKNFVNKILFNETGSYSSSGQRLKQWQRALSNFIKSPFLGNGPGFGVNEDREGYLSVYLTILSDVGIIAFLLFIYFMRILIQKIMRIDEPIRNFILFSAITSFLHLIIISDFYHAPVWILFFFIQNLYKEQKTFN